MGAYKRTPTAALKQESNVQSLDLKFSKVDYSDALKEDKEKLLIIK